MRIIRYLCALTLLVGACGTTSTTTQAPSEETTSTTTQTPSEDEPPCDLVVTVNKEGDADCVWITDELHLVYAAVATQMATETHLDGVVHILDRVVPVPELDAPEASDFSVTRTMLSESTRSAIVAALPDTEIDFASDFRALQTEHCRRGTSRGVILFYGLGVVRQTEKGAVEVLVEFNDVNNPHWNVATLDRTVDGWVVTSVDPTGMASAGDECL